MRARNTSTSLSVTWPPEGKVRLVAYDLAASLGIVEQLPAISVGTAVEVVRDDGHAFQPSKLGAEALARIFGTVYPLPNLEQTWNMAPTRDAPVVRLSRDGQRHFDALRWGLVPYFTKDIKKARKPINARDDNVAKSGMFKDAFARRRCLVAQPHNGATIRTARRRSLWRASMANPLPSVASGNGGGPQKARSSRRSPP